MKKRSDTKRTSCLFITPHHHAFHHVTKCKIRQVVMIAVMMKLVVVNLLIMTMIDDNGKDNSNDIFDKR